MPDSLPSTAFMKALLCHTFAVCTHCRCHNDAGESCCWCSDKIPCWRDEEDEFKKGCLTNNP